MFGLCEKVKVERWDYIGNVFVSPMFSSMEDKFASAWLFVCFYDMPIPNGSGGFTHSLYGLATEFAIIDLLNAWRKEQCRRKEKEKV